MNPDTDPLSRLQSWYWSMCNDCWEHTNGIFVSNIDNPGWSLKIELNDTYLCDAQFKDIQIQRSDENDWLNCKVENGCFQGYGGPFNLGELIQIFLTWAQQHDSLRLLSATDD